MFANTDLTEAMMVDAACLAYRQAKADEEAARKRRLQAEDVITGLVKNEKPAGAKSLECGNWKVSVTNKVTHSLDQDVVREIIDDLPDEQSAVKLKYELSMTGLKSMMEYYPEAVAILNRAMTTKPAKPTIKITEV